MVTIAPSRTALALATRCWDRSANENILGAVICLAIPRNLINKLGLQEAMSAHKPHMSPPGAPDADRGAALMLAWQGGDGAAFETLVHEFSGPVYGLLTRFLGAHPGREDLVQEVFLRILRAKDRYQPSARFTTWLYRITYNLSVNETERRSRHAVVSLSAPPDRDGTLEVRDGRAEVALDELQRGDTIDAVRAAIADLPETQRMALVLAKYEGLPYFEIATVLDSSEQAVKSLIHRARETLRERLAHLLTQDLA